MLLMLIVRLLRAFHKHCISCTCEGRKFPFYCYCLYVCLDMFPFAFINTWQILFCTLHVFTIIFCGCFYLQTVLQGPVGGFMQNVLPKASKIFVWHLSFCPQCFSPCILPVQFSPEQKVFFKCHETKIILWFLHRV